MTFAQALEFVLSWEGGYVNHPSDPGGETNLGITAQVARAYGYRGPMNRLTHDWARRIYRQGYWLRIGAEALPAHPLRLVLFDAAVNSGPGQALKWLQKELNLTADGILGPLTLEAVRQAAAAGPARLDALARNLITRREAFLKNLSTWRTFGRGWQRRLNALRQAIAQAALDPPAPTAAVSGALPPGSPS